MDNEKKNMPEEKPQYEKVEWFGVDGALVHSGIGKPDRRRDHFQ